LLGTLAGPLVAGLFYAYSMKEFAPLRQTLQPLFALAFAWSLAGFYILNRGMWPAAMPSDAGLSTGLEFCRRELERQRDLVRKLLLWSFGPIILTIGTFILALAMVSTSDKGLIPDGLPFLIAILAWICAYFVIRFREQRDLQREIEELNDIEEQNRA
jgi:MFS family permease